MTPVRYPAPSGEEWALAFDHARPARVLVISALFEEANRMRRLAVEVMRRLDQAGIDSFLPDLPGCGESLQPLEHQTPASWRAAADGASRHFGATHVLALRGGCLLAPPALPGWLHAPASGASLLRQMLRSRMVASREAGREESQEGLLPQARTEGGLELAGYRLSAGFLGEFATLELPKSPQHIPIAQGDLGGSGLWLRAEPDFDAAQADALAAIVTAQVAA